MEPAGRASYAPVIMNGTLLVHVLAGGSGLILGAIALSATKGGSRHRKAGILFVYAMLVMAFTGMVMAPLRGVAPAVNVPAALLTAYFVITALSTLRPRSAGSRLLDVAAALFAFGVGLVSLGLGLDTLVRRGWTTGLVLVIFGAVAIVSAAADVRMVWKGGLGGSARIARHLWRMCFALLIATTAFFLGQPDVFPRAVRVPVLLALPAMLVLVTLAYWLWRVRIKGGYRAVIGASTSPGRVTLR